MTTLMEKVRGIFADTVSGGRNRVKEFAARDAAGEQVNELEAVAALEAAGMTADDLQAEIALNKERARSQAIVNELPANRRASADIEAAQQLLNSEFAEKVNALRKAHHDETQVLYFQQRSVIQKINEGEDAAAWLCEHIPDDVKRRSSEVMTRINAKRSAIREIQDHRADLRGSGRASFTHNDGQDAPKIAALQKEIDALLLQLRAIEQEAV